MQVTTTYWEMKAVSVNPIHIGYGLQHYGIYYKGQVSACWIGVTQRAGLRPLR